MTTHGAPSPAGGGVRLDRDGPVATVTLCRPDVLNAQTPATWAALAAIGRDLPGDVRVVVVRGEGRSFSAGLDLAIVRPAPAAARPATAGADTAGPDAAGPGPLLRLAQAGPEEAAAMIATFQEGFAWLTRPDIVTVAAVQGHAVGAGFQLALQCDLRVLATDAKLAMGEVALGLVPDLGGTKPLVDLVGYARALEICATGRRIPAPEALAIGLANLVVPVAELDAAVADLVAALLAGSRDTVVEIKALLRGAGGRTPEEQRRAEREAQVRRLRDLAGIGE